MNYYFIAKVEVIIEGNNNQIEFITGLGEYDDDIVKNNAISRVRKLSLNSKIIDVTIKRKNITLKEYKNITGSNPPWLN